MHIPDGFLNGGTSLGGGAVAAGTVAYSLRRARVALAERAVALAGLVSAYVFAVQMLNFPVASGTSGHLLGGVLAAVLVGPWVGALCVAVVIGIQALVFADGGLSAIGLNVLNMALIGAMAGYAIFVGVRSITGRSRRGILIATGIAAWMGPVLASVAFALEYAIGGSGAVSNRTVLWSMVGVHALIGVGEAIITTLTVAAVLTSRPDLVYGAQGSDLAGTDVRTARRPLGAFAAAAAIVIVLVAAGAGPFASTQPDGLNKVAADKQLAPPAAASAPSPTYPGSGLLAVTAAVVISLATVNLVRRRNSPRPA